MEHRLTPDETSKMFEMAKPILNEINYTKLSQKERLDLIKGARFLDVRVRKDGREYYFEADFLKSLLDKLDDVLTRELLMEKTNGKDQ